MDLFADSLASRMNLQANPYSMIFPKLDTAFLPTFDDELIPDPKIAAACNNDSLCISDATISGLVSMGVDTKSGQAAVQNSVAQISKIIEYLISWSPIYFFFIKNRWGIYFPPPFCNVNKKWVVEK